MIRVRRHHDWPKRAGLGSVQFDLHCSPLFSSVLCGTGTIEPQPINRCNRTGQDHTANPDRRRTRQVETRCEEEGSIRSSAPASRLLTFFLFFLFHLSVISSFVFCLSVIYETLTPPFDSFPKTQERTL